MKKMFLLAAVLISFARPSSAFDPKAFAVHLRKTLALDTRTDIQVSSVPVPSGISDLVMVTAYMAGAPYPVYMTKDEKKYIWGFVVDPSVDPDKEHEQQISLKGVHFQGLASAPITVVEYSDLQCSHCKQAHDYIKAELYKAYKPEQVRFIYKHFPLSGHDWAEPAAVASECAGAQKDTAFWDMVNFYFSNQDKVNKETVKQKGIDVAKGLKLDEAKFTACLASDAVLQKVRAQKKEGVAVGVNSTPTLFINGRSRRGFRDFEDIRVVIEEKLAEIKK